MLGPARRIRRADGLVRVLRVLRLAVRVEPRSIRQVLLPVHHLDVVARLVSRGRRHASGVGAHVGDQADSAFLTDLDSFVEILRQPHRPLGAEAQFLRRVLLERARRERRGRILAPLATLYFRDLERLARLERGENLVGFALVADDGLLAVEQVKLRGELLLVFFQQRLDRPVLDRLERADLALALDEQPKRDSLHASGRDPLLHGLPEDRAGLVADESIENPARLLRIDLALVDLSGVGDRELHRIARDLVKENAPDRRAVLRFDLLRDVPRDRFALAIRIGRQKDLA